MAGRESPGSDAPAPNGRARRVRGGEQASSRALLFATAPAGDGGPAAGLEWEQTTLLGRLLEQIAELGVREAHLITRPDWAPELERRAAGHGIALRVQPSPDTAADLRAAAAIARDGSGTLVVANADILTQGEALAGLLADPRVATGMLTTTVRRMQRYVGFRTRTRRGRVVSAASAYHNIHQPNGTFLGVLKVAPPHREALAAVAERLAALVDGSLPEGWSEELEAKAGRWKLALYRRALAGAEQPEGDDSRPDEEPGAPEDESELSPDDVELAPQRTTPS